MRTRLSVNLNKVALLRNQRDVGYPSVTGTAELVIAAGAAGITVHPRPDERHIRQTDAIALGALLAAPRYSEIEYNIEGNPTAEFLELVCRIVPQQVTLVPDSPEQATSDHGWALAAEHARLGPIVDRLRSAGIRVSLFVDPEPELMSLAGATGAERIELYTEPYANAFAKGDFATSVKRYVETAAAALEAGLAINAGHDLNLDNLAAFKSAIPELAEVSIGHAITADALKFGFPAAVAAYLAVLEIGGRQ
jgi:pyridoxine 5-phosphate synthase